MGESLFPGSFMTETRSSVPSAGRALLMSGAAWLTLACASAAHAQQNLATIPQTPVIKTAPPDGLGDDGYYLESDLLIRDDKNQIMTAEGAVEARYQGRTLRADKVIYDSKTGAITADGNVQLINPDGTAEFADHLELDRDMKAGFARNFAARLEQNMKVAAASAVRRNENIQELNKAIYTPCEVCAEKPTPTWSVSADKIVQDKPKQLIYYKNAVIRMWGAPVLYLPLFWHPDPQAKRSSGFLAPKLDFSRGRGVSYNQPYYHVISPSSDVILAPQINSQVNPFLNVTYRKRFYSGTLEARGGFTYDKEFDIRGDRFGEETFRSYVLANGKFDINQHWKWGFSAERVSDALLFDKYKINDVYQQRGLFTSDDHRLVSQLYATRQAQRSWFSVSAVSVQGLRVVGVTSAGTANAFENSGTFPLIGPLVEARWEPEKPVLGGRLRLQGSGVMLNRSESQFGEAPYFLGAYKGQNGVDSSRASVKADWRASNIIGPGLKVSPFVQARGDAYSIKTFVTPAASALGDDTQETYTRALGVGGVDFSLPFYKPLTKGGSVVLEPLAQVALGSDSSRVPVVVARDGTKRYLYNEDSATIEFDETNLFQANKSPGFDLYEGGQRLNVGGRATFARPDGRGGSILVGRSFRSEFDPLLPTRTGLQMKSSDWIVAATVTPVRGINAFVRTRLDSKTQDIHRIETGVDAFTTRGSGSVRYLKDELDANGNRQENFEARGELKLTKRFSVTAFGQRDMVQDVWRRRDLGVAYQDDCVRIDVIYQQEDRYASTASGLRLQPDRTIVFRLTLATLGDTGYSSN
ncbi:LPS-assembly protein LptD [Caulobacter vibrioides]|uniref:LPS-assembly protein LptD n=1 Tax=Caulobacter vibrioides TaxID=155892 RepID=UPI000BB4B896|nr:LPS-assembly protein LptD [Caulobacter vibrioides]ATC24694.1 LPS-assembly protein LptD [Caulobacter vibrioides]AZH12833.1 LPS-assembly protein LptD [Caulobacter vibrioides]PLR09469.1 LPS-assembly protein LptD [Caulobacter vibrioides]